MLDIKFIRENKELVRKNCADRRVKIDLDKLFDLDERRRSNLQEIEELRATRNKASSGKEGKPSADEIKAMREIGGKIKKLEEKQEIIDKDYKDLMGQIPNMTHPSSPIGGEDDFRVIFTNREPKPFSFPPKDHEELLVKNNLIDFERATKVSGAKFYYFKNNLVRLTHALLDYGMDITTKHSYELLETPDLARNDILEGIGFNPRGKETQVYSIENSDLSLIGTAEITIGGMHQNEVLDLSTGPKKYVAVSHCFRTEAGAYGRTSKGLYRVHQFTKLEMFVFCKPEDSEKYHEEILNIEKEIVDGLDIPYRVIDISSGDLGGPAYRKFDIEAWMTMKGDKDKQGGYGEITSCSNCADYQARRLNIKYKTADGTNEFVHTLNGTAVVLSRFPIVIAENHQQKDGSIRIPKKLKKLCGFKKL
ncbi:MAG: serine--tRNA ligase [Candidatus Magasanikbacteria bacterium CG10_big_fil_rev_8_21_14_0_10_36_32]|uniref:Serine--tRNA ligase n=1 Tax=Candidatus Magasanikbacteria bacterium CG10_big_fil_rev_8_21_14_0_10_36_32 TaxID=1974646 RepID=A0A2M6W7N9_9BACT|nr:MAG: serine--tRNA ligase [Candidatus Magasanikbacteria bacterium CG10_big_fil_rev_8_21_14_0_10_36_32]